jgi:hypothetical protein
MADSCMADGCSGWVHVDSGTTRRVHPGVGSRCEGECTACGTRYLYWMPDGPLTPVLDEDD